MNKLIPIFLLISLAGCSNNNLENSSEINFNENAKLSKMAQENNAMPRDPLVEVIDANEIELHESAYLLDSVMADLTGDDIEEEILLYISPSPFDEETGEAIYWEDLHLWQVIVKNGEKTYPLYNYDLGGKLSFWVTPEKQLLLVQDAVHLVVYEFTYVDGIFERKALIDSGITFKRSVVEW
ncbi:hypothetical protein [Solibacillus sp. CAU 1738]|uniref:hypothetical protein n=1 Tax=Solibacillus sp. CAU 1738 TaxID=3140363 RepID=UPI0032610848